MKPTNRHIELCELIKSQANFWIGTNDIDSPTHLCDIAESLNGIEWLSEHDWYEMEDCLNQLYYTVRKIGK